MVRRPRHPTRRRHGRLTATARTHSPTCTPKQVARQPGKTLGVQLFVANLLSPNDLRHEKKLHANFCAKHTLACKSLFPDHSLGQLPASHRLPFFVPNLRPESATSMVRSHLEP